MVSIVRCFARREVAFQQFSIQPDQPNNTLCSDTSPCYKWPNKTILAEKRKTKIQTIPNKRYQTEKNKQKTCYVVSRFDILEPPKLLVHVVTFILGQWHLPYEHRTMLNPHTKKQNRSMIYTELKALNT